MMQRSVGNPANRAVSVRWVGSGFFHWKGIATGYDFKMLCSPQFMQQLLRQLFKLVGAYGMAVSCVRQRL